MQLLFFLGACLSVTNCLLFDSEESAAIKRIFGLEEQTNEIRAQLWTLESDVNYNSNTLNKTKKYTELVHAAWKEAIEMRKSLLRLDGKIDKQKKRLLDESESRSSTDRILIDLINSILSMLQKDETELNLKKSGISSINGTAVNGTEIAEKAEEEYELTIKLEEELTKIKDKIEQQENTIDSQKAKINEADFDFFHARLYALETALNEEEAKRDELEQLLVRNKEIFGKQSKDSSLERLRSLNLGSSYDVSQRFEELKTDFYDNFAELKLNLTEALVLIEEKNEGLGNMTDRLETMRDVYLSRLEDYRNEIQTIDNITQSVYMEGGDALINVREAVMFQDEQMQNNTEQIQLLTDELDVVGSLVDEIISLNVTARKKQNEEHMRSLEQRLHSLEYGLKFAPPKGAILVTGGEADMLPKFETHLISGDHGVVSTFSPLVQARSSHCTIKLHDEIYVIGGAWSTASKLDKELNEWVEIEEMMESRDYGPGCAVYEDRIWVCGGFNGLNETVSCESYNPEDGWVLEAPLLAPVSSTTAAVNSLGLFILGGHDQYGENNYVQVYDPKMKAWSYFHDLPVLGLKDGSSVTIDDEIYVVGGTFNENSILKWDDPMQLWTNVTTLETDHVGGTAVAIDKEIWVIGGQICFEEVCDNNIEIYNTETGELKQKKLKNAEEFNYISAVVV